MKYLVTSLLFICLHTASFAQSEFVGIWQGPLKFNNVELRIVFRIFGEGDSLKAFLDSPDQGAKDIPVSSVKVNDNTIRLDVAVVNGYFEGKLNRDSVFIDGIWSQGGSKLPLKLIKIEKVEEAKRPQNPEKPYPYNEEEVIIENHDAGVSLAGIFTYPKEGNNFPAVILVSGSGMQDRDESLLDHKPFLVLSDYLTRQGIAVLRYDDRGGNKSTGDFLSATTMDFVSDVIAAANYLAKRKEVDKKKIGIAGHSEGGIIAPLAANRENNISFIVLMAGTGMRGDKILLAQSELISRAAGETEDKIAEDLKTSEKMYDLIMTEKDTSELRKEIRALLEKEYAKLSEDEKKNIPDIKMAIEQQTKQMTSPWFINFVKYDPYTELKKVDVPVLAIIGENDLQVPAKQNLELIEKALKEAGNKNYKIVEMPGLNHLFQTSKTGAVTEYAKIEETFSPDAMKVIAGWILSVTENLK